MAVMNLKELAKRLLVAGVAIPIVCFCVAYPVFMNLITVTLSFVGSVEWILLRRHVMMNFVDLAANPSAPVKEQAFPKKPDCLNDQVQVYAKSFLAVFLPIVAYWYHEEPFYVLAVTISIYIIMFVCTIFGWMNSGMLSRDCKLPTNMSPQQSTVFDMVALTLDYFGILYSGFNLAMAILILRRTPILLLLILFANWAADAFAMFAGKRFGKHKLCPSLSPNKTVEGAFGAVVGAVLLSMAVRFISLQFGLFSPTTIGSNSTFFYNGVLLGVLGIVGDLLESYYKRVAVIKDSGDFFGAHGGVLDRIDGLLFSFPVMYIVNHLGYF